jgi:putative ABC transport system ATP-binding protein
VALRDASLTVAAGEIVAVRGPSGSGKSTLLQCLAGILDVEAGEVWYDGRRIDELDDEARSHLRRTAFGFVFQFAQLVPDLPARDNVALPLLLDGHGRAEADAAAMSALDRLGVAAVADRLPEALAGGEAQRVAVARAVVHGPRVVFADEPTGALDSVASEQVMRLLAGEARARECAVVLVTHDARIAAYAGREIAIRDGAL